MFELKLNKPQANAKPQPVKKVNALFAASMDDAPPQDTGRPKINALIAQKSYQKVDDEIAQLVMEDPTIYSYDTHYDEINVKRQELEQQKRQKTGPRHIQNIIKTCEKRKVEQNMIYEKIEANKLKREGQINPGQTYVTGSYKRMMEEVKKFREEDDAKEQYNKEHTAENKDNSLGMYKNLYQQDIFQGGYRPDLNTMLKQDKNAPPQQPAPNGGVQQEQTPKPEELGKTVKQPEFEEERDSGREQKTRSEIAPERKAKQREETRSRSRSRSKSPTKLKEVREEAKAEKKEQEKEKELTKEEKLKLAKERYLQRKQNQPAATGNEQ